MITITLFILPLLRVMGIYVVGTLPERVPDRLRMLCYEAAVSFLSQLQLYVVISDMYRTPMDSMLAVRKKRGALPPGYSGHNFGYSIDIDVDATIALLNAASPGLIKSKADLDQWMADRGWYCCRGDHKRGREDWHYNHLPLETMDAKSQREIAQGKGSVAALERFIQHQFGNHFVTTPLQAQLCLHRLGLYHGAPDGIFGPLSTEALRTFQRTWALPENGKLDKRTMRTLAVASAHIPAHPWSEMSGVAA